MSRWLRSMLEEMVTRSVVTLFEQGDRRMFLQLEIGQDELADQVVYRQAQGTHFRPPVGSEAILLALGGDVDNLEAILAHDPEQVPVDELEEGEGGLHYLGDWKVFLNNEGKVFIAARDAAEPVVRGETFKGYYDLHVHPTPFGPTEKTVELPADALSEDVMVP